MVLLDNRTSILRAKKSPAEAGLSEPVASDYSVSGRWLENCYDRAWVHILAGGNSIEAICVE